MSRILDVLAIDNNELFYSNNANLYHKGDNSPFAVLKITEGKAHLIVNSGEYCAGGIPFMLRNYEKQ